MVSPAPPAAGPLAIAIAHHRAGRVDAAERIYRDILSATPAHADAHHNLGIILIGQGNPGAALEHFRAALEADPTHAPFWLSLVEGLLACNDPDQALTVVDRAIECGLDTPPAQALRSRAAQAIARRNPA